jgi:hypothetical protein
MRAVMRALTSDIGIVDPLGSVCVSNPIKTNTYTSSFLVSAFVSRFVVMPSAIQSSYSDAY